jgi:hypothetical protein
VDFFVEKAKIASSNVLANTFAGAILDRGATLLCLAASFAHMPRPVSVES